MIDRMFDNLRADQPVMRWNWSLHEDGELYHPTSHSGTESLFGGGDEVDEEEEQEDAIGVQCFVSV